MHVSHNRAYARTHRYGGNCGVIRCASTALHITWMRRGWLQVGENLESYSLKSRKTVTGRDGGREAKRERGREGDPEGGGERCTVLYHLVTHHAEEHGAQQEEAHTD